MSLTGSPFLTLAVGLTMACFVGLVVGWPRLAGRGVRRVAARVGLLLGINGLVLFTAAVLVNAQFLVFADWADLRGAVNGSTSTTSLARGGDAGQAAGAKVPGVAGAAIVMGGYFSPTFGSAYEPYPSGSPLESRYNLVALVRRAPASIALWLAVRAALRR